MQEFLTHNKKIVAELQQLNELIAKLTPFTCIINILS